MFRKLKLPLAPPPPAVTTPLVGSCHSCHINSMSTDWPACVVSTRQHVYVYAPTRQTLTGGHWSSGAERIDKQSNNDQRL